VDITKSRKGFGLIKYNSLDFRHVIWAATVCRPELETLFLERGTWPNLHGGL
jgi:hypothetical protein